MPFLFFLLIGLCTRPQDVTGFSPINGMILKRSAFHRNKQYESRHFVASVEETPVMDTTPSTSKMRPLHQNWWPVALVNSLKTDRPNAIELLGMRLVLLPSNDDEWSCLDDRCSHRFAPLSEGRLIQDDSGNSCIQCAYHGWEFSTSTGECTKVPQSSSSGGKSVTRYPVRNRVGMIWVWSDPSTASTLADTVDLPISPLMERYYAHYGDAAGFQRDLPYGMELLGENLMDLSHLPFSHHSVGGLSRDLGGPLPLQMLSEESRKELAADEPTVPVFQAQLQGAAMHDPVFLGMAKRVPVPDNATTTIGYFDPSHVRYHRIGRNGTASDTQLFMCPTRAGHSRVFLFNIFEAFLPPPDEADDEPKKRSIVERLKSFSLLGAIRKAAIARLLSPSSTNAHMMSHAIFDGDGIFLHKQGDRMRRSGLTYRDYDTPSSADVLLNSYRRFLDSAAHQASALGYEGVADSVGGDAYLDDESRSALLDRYESHTVHCQVCSTALAKCRRRRDAFARISTALTGAAGTFLTSAVVLALSGGSATPALFRLVGLSSVVTTAGSIAAAKASTRMQKESEKFLFEDYVHADKQ